MKPQGKTLFLLELMHTELKTVWRCSCQEFWTAAAVCNHWPFLIILFTPIASRSCFPDLPFPAAAEQSRAWELCWAEECCLPVLSKAGFPAQTCTAEHLTLLGEEAEQKWWLWKPVLESRHSSVVWSRMHSQASSWGAPQGFLSMVLIWGLSSWGQGLPWGRAVLCSAHQAARACAEPCQWTCSSHFGKNLESVE